MACADYKGGVINNIDASHQCDICAGERRGCVFKPHLFCSGRQVATGHRRDGSAYLGFNSLTVFCFLQNPRRKGTACLIEVVVTSLAHGGLKLNASKTKVWTI